MKNSRAPPASSPLTSSPLTTSSLPCATPSPVQKSLVHQLVEDALVRVMPKRAGRRKETKVTPKKAQETLAKLVNKRWVDSTLRGRAGLLNRLISWAKANELSPLKGDTICLFVMAMGVAPSSLLQAAKSFSAILPQIGIPEEVPPVRFLTSSLRATGAAIPQNQATPITAPHTRELIQITLVNHRPRLALAQFLCWICVSRWREVCILSPQSFLFAGVMEFGGKRQQTVVIDWWIGPKGRQGDPFRPSRFAVLVGQRAERCIFFLRLLGPVWVGPLAPSTDKLDAELARVGSVYRAHSFKRGAYQTLLRALNSLPLSSPARPSDVIVSRLLKHAHPGDLTTTTVRYGTGEVEANIQVALSLHTYLVTSLLPLV